MVISENKNNKVYPMYSLIQGVFVNNNAQANIMKRIIENTSVAFF